MRQARGTLDEGTRKHSLEAYDSDHDGVLSEQEREAMWRELDAFKARLDARRLARFDLNRDGKLDATEKAAMRDLVDGTP